MSKYTVQIPLTVTVDFDPNSDHSIPAYDVYETAVSIVSRLIADNPDISFHVSDDFDVFEIVSKI